MASFQVILLALASGMYPGCGDGQKEKLRAAQLAEGCILDSECVDPLVCAFKICHAMCDTDKDCVRFGYGRCVKVDGKEKAGVCQLPGERDCRRDAAKCTEDGREQVCAEDGQCRDACTSSSLSCLPDLECSTSGFCARADELEDGGLIGAGGAPGSAGGSGGADATSGGSGAAYSGGTGATSEDGGASGEGPAGGGTGGSGGTIASHGGTAGGEPTAGASDGGASGAGGADAGSGGDGGDGPTGPTSEEEPNDDKDHPTAIAAGVPVTATLASNGDHDFFQVTAPDDSAGGYFELAITKVGNGKLWLRVWPELYTGTIFERSTPASGASLYAYFAAAPGGSYFIEVSPFQGGQPYDYELVANYFPVPDPFEPNDTRATAKPIPLGKPVEAFSFAGYRTHTIERPAYDDWYELPELATGTVTVELSSAPDALASHLYLYGPGGGVLTEKLQSTLGANNVLTYTITAPGQHWVRVNYYVNPPATAGLLSTGVPTTFTDPYTLTVTQP